jgi:hypothetical protein
MLVVVKLLLVAIGLFGQARVLPDREPPVESELDTLSLPADHPEWVLARRAMASEGLCRPASESQAPSLAVVPAGLPEAPVDDNSIVRLVAEACK